ncbi:DUF2946 family protein [Nitrogeniibacter mangrovi]|uniref:DUF2946 family protein n=1 Tax=Nitrogeniibacter mangrovi TaxID=2016596 RepID=A0A6C1B354_9RHOO|nr:DUF2946 family protein [Nitrogeniibacter mangrovi]QID18081.1 DUF2946 family protein [Nitrogeniibacter mangrovi]
MDTIVRSAMAKWPNVPDLFGWLSLDERGRWRIQDSPIDHPGLIEFIGRNYDVDDRGRWFFQNGPQRVFVDLHYTPWIVRSTPMDGFVTQTGQAFSASTCLIDDEGHLLLARPGTVALIDDRDLMALCDRLTRRDGTPIDPVDLLHKSASIIDIGLDIAAGWLPVERMERHEVATRFGFTPKPAADAQPRP